MINRENLVIFLSIFLAIISIIIGIESYFGWFANPLFWAGYLIVSLVIIWLFIRSKMESPQTPVVNIMPKAEEFFAKAFPKAFEQDSLTVDLNRIPEPTAM